MKIRKGLSEDIHKFGINSELPLKARYHKLSAAAGTVPTLSGHESTDSIHSM